MASSDAVLIRSQLQRTVFGRVDPAALDSMVSVARVERHASACLLSAAGQPLQQLRWVVEGGIALVVTHASGRQVTVSEIGPGAWATWLPCFTPAAPDHDFVASAHSVFVALPVAQVRQCCERHPALYPLVITEIGQRLRLLLEWTGQSVFLTPVQRMAKLIALLARHQGLSGLEAGATLQVTQQRLAALAHCSRQSANALVQELQRLGLIRMRYGKCEILDGERLQAFTETDVEDAGG
ncbi:MAG: Crp/Fnr family transcriptional regulator [Rhodoferax sp.]